MPAEPSTGGTPRVNPFSSQDVESILRGRGWLTDRVSNLEVRVSDLQAWLEKAAGMLGAQAAAGAADLAAARANLEELLGLVFEYDARAVLAKADAQEVLTREGAREVLRELALLVLDEPAVDSDRFKQVIDVLKDKTQMRGRKLFHPLRLALAGRAGEGELDRVILLLDEAARLEFAVPVKGTRQRMLEFCSAME